MNYQIEIKSIVESSTITVGATDKDLVLQELEIEYNYLNFSSPGSASIVGFKDSTLKPSDIHPGDIIFIYEETNLIFVGYLTTVSELFSETGISIRITFDTLLSRFSQQKMINRQGQVVFTQGPKTVTLIAGALNFIQFQVLLDFMMTGTLYDYFRSTYGFGAPSSKFQIIYEATQYLSKTTNILYAPYPGSTKEAALRRVLYPYQIIPYQDPQGNLRFSIPSYSNRTDLNINYGDTNVNNISIVSREVQVLNNVMVSLIQGGFFTDPPDAKNSVSLSSPNRKYFPYLSQLRDTGYYDLTDMIFNPLPSNASNDPTITNALTALQSNPSLSVTTEVPSNASTIRKIAALYSSRIEGEALTNAKNVKVTLTRTPDYTEIPLAKIFTANQQDWLCTKCILSLSVHDQEIYNTITLMGSPLSTATGAWIE